MSLSPLGFLHALPLPRIQAPYTLSSRSFNCSRFNEVTSGIFRFPLGLLSMPLLMMIHDETMESKIIIASSLCLRVAFSKRREFLELPFSAQLFFLEHMLIPSILLLFSVLSTRYRCMHQSLLFGDVRRYVLGGTTGKLRATKRPRWISGVARSEGVRQEQQITISSSVRDHNN